MPYNEPNPNRKDSIMSTNITEVKSGYPRDLVPGDKVTFGGNPLTVIANHPQPRTLHVIGPDSSEEQIFLLDDKMFILFYR
jgi:hypothetical protein